MHSTLLKRKWIERVSPGQIQDAYKLNDILDFGTHTIFSGHKCAKIEKNVKNLSHKTIGELVLRCARRFLNLDLCVKMDIITLVVNIDTIINFNDIKILILMLADRVCKLTQDCSDLIK